MTGHTVVIADDEAQVASAIGKLLESSGHTVVGTAATGEEAVWLNQVQKPDVVLLDLQMPGMNGLVAAKRIMATRPVPIVVCSAYFDDSLISAATRLGVYAYVVKPCRLADLLPAINVAISRFEDAKLLRSEVLSLKSTLEDRKFIEQAKGIVMRTRGLGEVESHRFLQQQSQRQSRPLAEIARAIVMAEEALSPRVYGGGKSVRCRVDSGV